MAIFLSADTALSASGFYVVTVAGITLTLPPWSAGISITIKDRTGSSTPDITVITGDGSTIDAASELVINDKNESVTFVSYLTNQFIVI